MEADLLDYFWHSSQRGNKLRLLRQLAAIVIPRPEDWDRGAIRAQMGASTAILTSDACFLCDNASRVLHWHHLIQVQHGGSNTFRNFVALCPSCHGRVHPWLKVWPVSAVKGWYCVGDVAQQASHRTAKQERG